MMTRPGVGWFFRQALTVATSAAVVGLTGFISAQAAEEKQEQQALSVEKEQLQEAIQAAIRAQVAQEVASLANTSTPDATSVQGESSPKAAVAPAATAVPAPAPAAPAPAAPAPAVSAPAAPAPTNPAPSVPAPVPAAPVDGVTSGS